MSERGYGYTKVPRRRYWRDIRVERIAPISKELVSASSREGDRMPRSY